VFWKIALVGIAIVALMVVARDQHWAGRAGVTGSCTTTQPPSTEQAGSWYACKQGVLTGFPALEGDGCTSVGVVMHQEVWRCPAPLVSSPGY
jgi:hypothetical protein